MGVDPFLINMADVARGKTGIPFIPISGVRSVEYNEHIGGVHDSAHLNGHAADWYCSNSRTAFHIVKSLLDVGINRIGLNCSMVNGKLEIRGIHSDIDQRKTQDVLWAKLYG